MPSKIISRSTLGLELTIYVQLIATMHWPQKSSEQACAQDRIRWDSQVKVNP